MSTKWKDIGTLLLEYGLISENDLKEGLKLQKETGQRLGEALVKLGSVSMEDIDWVLSKQLDIPFVIVEDVTPNVELLGKFQKEFLINNKILPLFETEDQISIVAEDPLNKTAIGFIEGSFGKKVNISTGSGRKIKELLINTYKETVFPELVSALNDITERIRRTSFYRIDFLLSEHSCLINIFGAGILKNIATINGVFTMEDVLTAFDELNIPLLYENASAEKKNFIMTYPLLNRFEIKGLPAVTGEYGLLARDEILFTDAHPRGLPHFFHSDNPVHGYKYYSTRGNNIDYINSIYVIDVFPADTKECYVRAFVPVECPACKGAGCPACGELGYEFNELEGIYSSDELRERLKRS